MAAGWLRTRWLLMLIVVIRLSATAQTGGSGPNQSQSQPEGWEGGGYVIHQSIEIGYRGSDVTGSQQMYDTLVDLRSGPRLLDQSLSMQSQAHDGVLFDNLFISSFGWGGDPNNALHARVDLDKWYDFRAAFRRDQTDFDYNLLANPLNPPTSSPSIPVTASPHSFFTRRRMSDFDLTLLPQSKIDFRLGYSRNNMTGPSYSSVHEGTDALLLQDWNTTLNSYRFGVDLKLLPNTVISYDQFLDYYKGDTSWQLDSFAPALLPTGAGVELGLPIDTVNKNPCAIVKPATSLISPTGVLTNLDCNAYFAYNRSDRTRTSTPTERVSLRGTYFERLEFAASYSYSSADMNAPLNEFFDGLVTRTDDRQVAVTGPGHANMISNVADFTVTLHFTKHVRLVDIFRFWAYRIPQTFTSTETDWACTPPSICTLLTPISATTPTTTVTPDQLSFNQNWKKNESDLVWEWKHVGGSIGFRYGDQLFYDVDYISAAQDRVLVNEYTPVAGFWARPMTNLRFNFNWEHTNNSAAIVRIGPRKEARYRFQLNYTPKPWAVLGAGVNVWGASNENGLIDYRGHNRNYGLTANLSPMDRFGFDFAYNYNNYQQNAFVCFADSNVLLPVVANAGSCTANGYNETANPLLTYGTYVSQTHDGVAMVRFKPVARLTAQLGYSITSVGGQTPQFNALQPFGSLQYNYNQPLGSLAMDIGHNLTAKGGLNYYQYAEKSFVGPTDPRYFHANNVTVSLLWAF
jgi:hypothetical protein